MRSIIICLSTLDNFDQFDISSTVRLHPIQILSLILQMLLQGLGINFIYVY
jgi:hypothetical protein